MRKQKLFDVVLQKMETGDPKSVRAVIGFDGFVDEVVYPVDKRYDADRFDRIKYLADYGKKICDSAGLSMNVEMLPVQEKLGGNGPIFANSLAKHGFDVTYIGALGKESVHPVFYEFGQNAHLISISDPGHTDAIEFLDGKIISCKLEPLKEVNWKNFQEKVGAEVFAELLDRADFIGFENWTLVVNTTEVWKGIIQYVLPILKHTERKKLFIDLADPEKRTKEDILEAIRCLEEFEKSFEVILGLNEKESYEIAALYGYEKESFESVLDVARLLKEKIQISTIVVHPVKTACAAGADGAYQVEGPYCQEPRLTTGAGDNFNAGFVLGQMLGCTLEESLLVGVANSGFYVRNARSANYEELQKFIMDWNKNVLD
ncbi:hypothetical protein H8S44_03045 [Anaerosacchariphilus sp. NSJ-68]|uniref:Carbohydrate kinase family protein n=2 Tax=Lachnospiraceae TaxID=186803 RepID=A0A923RMV2_9FIRM|nr:MULTISPECIES: PfkB family carbohydrate kinase [Lachnospiraceae]MBC5658750.1 hypothetical protein [Anaerosacchariphilus hominis]MBC5698981.1 hypothetical protein [Roseburia difficilis]